MRQVRYSVAASLDGFIAGPGFVFSKTLAAGERPDHTVIAGDAAEFVRGLREQEGKDILLFGGGSLFGSLVAAAVVDLVEIAIVPVLLGAGVPLLPTPQIKRKHFGNGMLWGSAVPLFSDPPSSHRSCPSGAEKLTRTPHEEPWNVGTSPLRVSEWVLPGKCGA